MEKRDLYDKNRALIGKTILKDEQIPENTYCLMVMIFMENVDGRFLIQKRSKSKGGKWATTGGHPKAGEDSIQGLLTEVKEELNLDISKENIQLLKTKIGHGFICDLYYVKMNINLNDIICQEEEVTDVKLSTIDEIKEMINDGTFHKGHGQTFIKVLEILNK